MKIILVTGGNRGIGLEICRQLDELGYTVILGSRELKNGELSAKSLSKNVYAKQLDVTDEESIQKLFEFVKTQFGKLDVLINNAGIGPNTQVEDKSLLIKTKNVIKKNFRGVWKIAKNVVPLLRKTGLVEDKESAGRVSLIGVKHIMETNFYGSWRMIQVFVPLLRKSKCGQILNVSSGMGELNSLSGIYPGYSLSKSSLNALTIMFSNELRNKGINVNAMCPGWVKTDMGGEDAPLHVSQGADTAVWLATKKNTPNGKFFRNRKEINW